MEFFAKCPFLYGSSGSILFVSASSHEMIISIIVETKVFFALPFTMPFSIL
jgi:hypothetical protein